MSTVENERNYWDSQVERIGADRAAWDDEQFDQVAQSTFTFLNTIFAPKPHQKILDIGCGAGRILFPLAAAHPDTTFIGIDVSPAMVSEALRRADSKKLFNVYVLDTDGRHIPQTIVKIDGAYSVLVFQHLDPETVHDYITQVASKLRQGGKFVFQFVVGDPSEDSGFSHALTFEQVKSWLTAVGMQVVRIENDPYSENWRFITAEKV